MEFYNNVMVRMAYGNEAGIVIIDIEQRVCLLNVGSPDLYGAQDPYSRVPRSPKKGQTDAIPIGGDRDERQPRSPSIDQVSINECVCGCVNIIFVSIYINLIKLLLL